MRGYFFLFLDQLTRYYLWNVLWNHCSRNYIWIRFRCPSFSLFFNVLFSFVDHLKANNLAVLDKSENFTEMDFSRLIFLRRLLLTGVDRRLQFSESGIGFFEKDENKNLKIVLHETCSEQLYFQEKR